MNEQDQIALWSRIIESSPVIVILCVMFIVLLLRWYRDMQERLEKKDEQIIALQRETLQAMHNITAAVDRLTDAINRNQR
jgi:predicted signal transduction protein with EAL and GGDEF domain